MASHLLEEKLYGCLNYHLHLMFILETAGLISTKLTSRADRTVLGFNSMWSKHYLDRKLVSPRYNIIMQDRLYRSEQCLLERLPRPNLRQ
jgi:hypothetical protein